MTILRILIDVLFVIGAFFALAGVVGIIRMPDAYCRMQASTNTATLGALSILAGLSLYGFFISGSIQVGVKSIIVGLFILLTNPIGSHALARASKRAGVKMVEKTVCDEYGRDNPQ
jgi:multicomponent Na+:H+ antiporter subunit G